MKLLPSSAIQEYQEQHLTDDQRKLVEDRIRREVEREEESEIEAIMNDESTLKKINEEIREMR